MSKIEREMIAEARAAREAKHDTSASVSDTELGVDRPSAPNDEQTQDAQWWQYGAMSAATRRIISGGRDA